MNKITQAMIVCGLMVGAVSTASAHIDWISHLNWWLEPSIEKFVLLKKGKAGGVDEMLPEFIKKGG